MSKCGRRYKSKPWRRDSSEGTDCIVVKSCDRVSRKGGTYTAIQLEGSQLLGAVVNCDSAGAITVVPSIVVMAAGGGSVIGGKVEAPLVAQGSLMIA